MRPAFAALRIRTTGGRIPWGREDQELLAFHKAVIAIHKDYAFLRDGSLEFLWNDHQGLSYGRFSHEEQLVVVINNLDRERKAEVAVWKTGISAGEDGAMTRILLSHKYGFTKEEAEYGVHGGILTVQLLPYSVSVFYHRNGKRRILRKVHCFFRKILDEIMTIC